MLLLTSAMLAALIDRRDVRLKQPVKLDGSRPLPATLNHFTLRFEIARACWAVVKRARDGPFVVRRGGAIAEARDR